MSQGLVSGDLCGTSRNVGYPAEKAAQTRVCTNKVLIRWPKTTLGVQDPSVALSHFQGEVLNTKTISWVGILKLTRTVSHKHNYRSQKARVIHFEISRKYEVDELGLCFRFGRWINFLA